MVAKVSKPLMEKKRRARINKCLDQLKSLLESYDSANIRKRKLEKADILELTVNHLRNLQKLHGCAATASEFSDYHCGFRRCLSNVSQYLLIAEKLNGSDRCALSQLSAELSLSRGRAGVFSTMDSGPDEVKTRKEGRMLPLAAAGPEEEDRSRSRDPEPSSREDTKQLSGNKQAVFFVYPTTNSHEERSGHKKLQRDGHLDAATDNPRNVWRPW